MSILELTQRPKLIKDVIIHIIAETKDFHKRENLENQYYVSFEKQLATQRNFCAGTFSRKCQSYLIDILLDATTRNLDLILTQSFERSKFAIRSFN